MLVKFNDIHITRGQALLPSVKHVKKSDTVPITNASNINFESVFSITESIESMLNWLGEEVISGNHILFAKSFEEQSNDLLSRASNNDIIAINDLVRVSPQFLYYYLYLKKKQITINTKSGQRISKEKLTKLVVPIPNLTAQKNIIASVKQQIEQAEALTKKIQKEIARSKKENNQVLLKAFSTIDHFKSTGRLPHSDTKIVRIKEAGIVQAGKTPNGSIRNYFGNEYPFYNQTAFEQGMDIRFASRHLSARGMRAARIFNENSILVCYIGAQFGKAGIARGKGCLQFTDFVYFNL